MSGVYIPKMKLPRNCGECPFFVDDGEFPFVEDDTWCGRANYLICDGIVNRDSKPDWCDLIPVPEHGDLIDRDALIKDGWLNLHKEVMRMGGYAIHELPLKNPSIPVIIPAEEEQT